MSTKHPRNQPTNLTDAEYAPLIDAYLAGNRDAAERLSGLLTHHARLTVKNFMNRDPLDADDLAQDSVLSVLEYLTRRGGFSGSLVHFTISVTRNRCRNHMIWKNRNSASDIEPMEAYLSDSKLGPLDLLAEKELVELLQQSMDRLEDRCRDLLRALYIEDVSIEEMRRQTGLETVQAVYYRRSRCLKLLGNLLKNRLRDCSLNRGATDV
jgi:RNA polymerase sigma factor (sigma-70 family)